jgi:hypothetical protein
MKNVYANREADIMLKKKVKEEQHWLKQHDKQQIDMELERMNKAHQDKALNDALTKKAH